MQFYGDLELVERVRSCYVNKEAGRYEEGEDSVKSEAVIADEGWV